MGRTLSKRRKLTLVLLAVAAGTFAVEAYVRLFHAHEVSSEALRERLVRGWHAPLMRYDEAPELYYQMRPDLDLALDGTRVTTDSSGFRTNPDEAPPDPVGAVRVAVIGASTTFGVRVPAADVYTHRLGSLLEARWGRPAWVRSFAVPGYNSMQQAALLEASVLAWHPDLVVWHYDHRDAFPMLLSDDPIRIAPELGDNLLHSAALKLVIRRRHAHEVARYRYQGRPHELCDDYFVSGPFYDLHLEALERAGSICGERGIPVLFVLFDTYILAGQDGLEHFETLHAPLVPRLERAGFVVHDLFPRYQAVMEANGWTDLRSWWLSTHPKDGHPNAEGHAFLADEIAAALDSGRFSEIARADPR